METECRVAINLCCGSVEIKAATIHIYHRPLLLLLSPKADTHFTVPWKVEGRVDLHTHPFNGPFSGTTQVGRYQKGKTNLDFTEETVIVQAHLS